MAYAAIEARMFFFFCGSVLAEELVSVTQMVIHSYVSGTNTKKRNPIDYSRYIQGVNIVGITNGVLPI